MIEANGRLASILPTGRWSRSVSITTFQTNSYVHRVTASPARYAVISQMCQIAATTAFFLDHHPTIRYYG
jgi:hypothetical protein